MFIPITRKKNLTSRMSSVLPLNGAYKPPVALPWTEILHLMVLVFFGIFSYVSFRSGHASTFSEGTQLQISLNSNASSVFATSIASAGMITIGIVILIDFFFDSVDKKGKINDVMRGLPCAGQQ